MFDNINIEKDKKKRKSYAENTALQLAQQRYYEKNKDNIKAMKREITRKWRANQDPEVLKEKERERAKKQYAKRRMLKQQEAIVTDENKTEDVSHEIISDLINLGDTLNNLIIIMDKLKNKLEI